MIIREEDTRNDVDRWAIRSIHEAAFGRVEEADLVDRLRSESATLLSLVAELDKRIVGHLLFSRIVIETDRGEVAAVSLAPIGVEPSRQRRGTGERLIREALNVLRERSEKIVLVVGHPNYYPRFGFSREKAEAIESPFSATAFMALELQDGALNGVCGRVKYPLAFGLAVRYSRI